MSAKMSGSLPKRTGAPAHMARRQRSWARGEARHAANRAANDRREAANRAFVSAQGSALGFTPLTVVEGRRKGAVKPPSEQARALRRLIRRRFEAMRDREGSAA